jgi:hypothetical protein
VAQGRRGLALKTIVDDDVDAKSSQTGRCCCRRFGHRRGCVWWIDLESWLCRPSGSAIVVIGPVTDRARDDNGRSVNDWIDFVRRQRQIGE